MKFLSCFALLACLLAAASGCDVDSNNEPVCASDNLNVPIRNFWDPTVYWLCNSAGAAAEVVDCPTAHLFNSASGECVMWNQWVWTNPCPNNSN